MIGEIDDKDLYIFSRALLISAIVLFGMIAFVINKALAFIFFSIAALMMVLVTLKVYRWNTKKEA